MRSAILGGSFDPIHLGHLFVADEVLVQLGYDRVIFVPALISPLKQRAPHASAIQRLEMLRLALGEREQFCIDEFEIAQTGASYTINTVHYVIDSGATTGRPGLIIGEDLVAGFERWRDADEIENLTDIILVRRPGQGDAQFARSHRSIDNLLLPISSSEIRRRIVEGHACRYLLPGGVFDYIQSQGLYKQG